MKQSDFVEIIHGLSEISALAYIVKGEFHSAGARAAPNDSARRRSSLTKFELLTNCIAFARGIYKMNHSSYPFHLNCSITIFSHFF